MRYCYDKRNKELATNHWKIAFLMPNTVVVGPSGLPCVVLKKMEPVGIMWPVENHPVGPDTFLQVVRNGPTTPMLVPVLDYNEWMVLPFEFSSPVDIIRAYKCRNVVPMPNYFGRRDGDAIPLLHFSAYWGFYGVAMATVRKMARLEKGATRIYIHCVIVSPHVASLILPSCKVISSEFGPVGRT